MANTRPDLVPADFLQLRVLSERLARRKNRGQEITLGDIYSEISKIRQLDISAIQDLEIETEFRLCYVRSDVKAILDEVRLAGNRVVAISDMYLPKAVVEKLLLKVGVVVDHIYVSSEVGKTKHRGDLFDHVRNCEPASRDGWIHYGDNFTSDVARAIARGVDAFHVPIARNGLAENVDGKSTVFSSLIDGAARIVGYEHSNHALNVQCWTELGARYTVAFGVLLCRLAHERAQETGSSVIYFLARDGYILQKIYKFLYPADTRPVRYLAASRRMVNFAAVTESDPNIEFLVKDFDGLTPAQLLSRIGVDHGDSEQGIVLTDRASAEAVIMRHLPQIVSRASAERAQVVEYLRAEELFDHEHAVVVDVGWFCSIQKTLEKLLKSGGASTQLHGVYLGTNVLPTPDFDVIGLCYTGPVGMRQNPRLAQHIEVLELMFTAPEQSIVTVEKHGSGEFFIKRLELVDEETRINAARHIESGVLAVLKKLVEADAINLIRDEDERQQCLRRFANLCHRPSHLMAATVSGIRHSTGFGGSKYENFLADGVTLKSPLKLLKTLLTSYWKEAFVKSLRPWERRICAPLLIGTDVSWLAYHTMPLPIRNHIKKVIKRIL
jgi:FMN phosphatase YigB (HAD superfamily)